MVSLVNKRETNLNNFETLEILLKKGNLFHNGKPWLVSK